MFEIPSLKNSKLNVKFGRPAIINFTEEISSLAHSWIKVLTKHQTSENAQIRTLIIRLDEIIEMSLYLRETLEKKYISIEEIRKIESKLLETFNRLRLNAFPLLYFLCDMKEILHQRQ